MTTDRHSSLMTWVAQLPTFSESKIQPTIDHFRDGIMTATILKNVIDHSAFSDLNTSPANSTPLVNVVDRMKEYFVNQVGHPIPPHLSPNVGRIIVGDPKETSRLIQLLLGCAVNCPTRDKFVAAIRRMEENVQVILMEAIAELLEQRDESLSIESPRGDMICVLQEKVEQLMQSNHDLTVQLSQLKDEKTVLALENSQLNAQLLGHSNDPESIQMSIKVQDDCKRELELLREENYKLEEVVNDYKLRVQVLEKQLSETHIKMASAASAAEEVVRLKDEMDSLREAALKAAQYENQIGQYKKKLEEMMFFKKSSMAIEERNEELHKKNMSLEEEIKKVSSLKGQVEAVKKELAEMQQRLSQETQRALKAEFDSRMYREQFETSKSANQMLIEEKSKLTEQLEELRSAPLVSLDSRHGGPVDSIQLLPATVQDRVVRLEASNEKLNKRLAEALEAGSSEGSKIIVEQLRKHEAELDAELINKTREFEDMENSYKEKIQQLEAQLVAKDEELTKKGNQYKKCIEKAKGVIATLEPTHAMGLVDARSENAELERARAVREMEDRLMTSAFYNLSMNLHRNSSDVRNSSTLLQKERASVSSGIFRRRSEKQ